MDLGGHTVFRLIGCTSTCFIRRAAAIPMFRSMPFSFPRLYLDAASDHAHWRRYGAVHDLA